MTVVLLKDAEKHRVHEKSNIQGDKINLTILVLLYSLQGALYGFTLALPIVFQNRNVSYADQAEFSFTSYPFCFKLLWAPLIDCVFSKRFGRRKTWLIPTQYLMGLTLLFVSLNLDDWLGSEDGKRTPKVRLLTAIFFMGMLFSAMQDVALDGWALTMLQRRNVGYASTCQQIGGMFGQFMTYVLSIVLGSKDICNAFRSVPQNHGFVNLADYMMFWSILFIASTTLVLIFKRDNSLEVIDDENCECQLSLKESYKHLWEISKLRPILMLMLILLTFSMGFGPQNGVAHLKMIDAGVPQDKFVLLTIPALPFQMLFSVLLRRSLNGPHCLHAFVKLIFGVVLAVVLFFAQFLLENHKLPVWYHLVLLFVYNIRTVIKYLMVVSMSAFFCRVSDPRFGGIYLTLMNTVINIGTSWPTTLSLWCVDLLTFGTCDEIKFQVIEFLKNRCIQFDGYFTETMIFTVIGALWLCWSRKKIYKLESLPPSEWVAEREEAVIVEDEMLPVITYCGPL